MKAYDFEYDGIYLSDFGFIICTFDGADLETVTNGSEITFNTVAIQGGKKYELANAQYDTCLEATFQICKSTCNYDDLELTLDELRDIMAWLNRKNFHTFRILYDEYMDLYFEASFNVNKLELAGAVVGLELNMTTNRPFALQEDVTITLTTSTDDEEISFYDVSEEEGYIYPSTTITLVSDGNLDIYNALEDRHTYIGNCVSGEVITMEYPIISTSESGHEIQNDFNWYFLRIANTFSEKLNDLTVSIPCTIEMTYSPIVKVGI